MTKTVELTASLEDYIEAIYHIVEEKKVARGKDIAASLDVTRASVTEALRSLSKKGLVNYQPYEVITLTLAGNKAARDVIHRHESLKKFFMEVLCVDEEIAETGACRVEHTAPREIIDRMTGFINFLQQCPRGGSDLIKGFAYFYDKGAASPDCADCAAKPQCDL